MKIYRITKLCYLVTLHRCVKHLTIKQASESEALDNHLYKMTEDDGNNSSLINLSQITRGATGKVGLHFDTKFTIN